MGDLDKVKMVKIYSLSDPEDDVIRYVGKTVKTLRGRLTSHINEKRVNHRTCWIKSVLNKGIEPKIDLIEEVSVDNWEAMEIYWIAQFKAWGFNLVNNAIGGVSANGYNHTNETKIKFQRVGMVRTYSKKTREKMSASRIKYEEDNKKEFLKRYEKRRDTFSKKSVEEIADIEKRRRQAIKESHKSMSDEDKKSRAEKIKKSKGIKCALIDDFGNIVNDYISFKDAANSLGGISRESVRNSCMQNRMVNGLKFKLINPQENLVN